MQNRPVIRANDLSDPAVAGTGGGRTMIGGTHAQSCQSTGQGPGAGADLEILFSRHIKNQGNGLLYSTCLLQLQTRLVLPLMTSLNPQIIRVRIVDAGTRHSATDSPRRRSNGW